MTLMTSERDFTDFWSLQHKCTSDFTSCEPLGQYIQTFFFSEDWNIKQIHLKLSFKSYTASFYW